MEQVGDEIIETSQEFRQKPFFFLVESIIGNIFFLGSKILFDKFFNSSFYTRRGSLINLCATTNYGIVMIISPTPGVAGIAEFAFEGFLAELTPLGLAGLLAVLWRLAI